ncbi:MAG: peptidyl-tRNA hydrolase Pth2 [Candidatus Aramenus sp.]|nr:peptidyl-tRNA hydrolase Pth2 [Candidatus Aramenus sp.]
MVVMVRSDLKLGKGKIAAQVAHAAVTLVLEIIEGKNEKWKEWLFRWIEEGQPKIVVKVDSLVQLNERLQKARAKGLPTTVIMDAGKTQVEPGTITCGGIGPAEDSLIDEITGDLKLL